MLEIIFLVSMCKSIGRTLREKGRKPTGYQALLVAAWFGGEFMGALVGLLALGGGGAVYLFALLGAAAGAIVMFVIVKNLQALNSPAMRGFPVASYRDAI